MTLRVFLCWMLIASVRLASAEDADSLASEVMKASGSDSFQQLKRLDFTFVHEVGGKEDLVAKHYWDLAKNTDTVEWAGKKQVVDLAHPPTEGDGKAAFARWTNDSYWLLAPLKLKDSGAMRTYGGTVNKDGKTYQVLKMQFQGVGLTPGDQYNLYINPETHLLEAWDYMPTPQKLVHATWEQYQEVNGLHLSTFHHFGEAIISFRDISAEK